MSRIIDLSYICKDIDFYYCIFGFHLGCHLEYIEKLNDAKVASLGFLRAMSAKQDSVQKTPKKLIPCPLGCKVLLFAISGLHLGYHLEYIKMLNNARVASLGFFKGKVC